ncbi:MAG: NfeD family protein [Clostridia bacterium]|nr:NfeD family protein [Clostridia bacterium]
MWQVWLILAGIFVIFEMIIPTDFLIFWVGVGAAITSICSIFIDNITIQIGIFCISSVLLLFCTKPFIKKFTKSSADMPTNAYSNIGKTGIVISDIDPISGKGQVKIGNEVWSAKSTNQEIIKKDTLIKVDSIEGVKVLVSVNEKSEIKI